MSGDSKHMAAERAGLIPPEPKLSIGQQLRLRVPQGHVNVETITRFLEEYRECGIIVRAALKVNLSTSSIRNLREKDPEFAAAMDEAKQEWSAKYLDARIEDLGFNGTTEPMFDKMGNHMIDEKTGEYAYKRTIHPGLILAFARKHDPAYRDNKQVEVNHSGGVVVLQAQATNKDEWAKEFGATIKPAPPRQLVEEAKEAP